MNTATIVGIIVVALVVVGGLVWYTLMRRQQTDALQTQYGPEYERTVSDVGSRRAAEAELVKRQERVEHFEIRPLLAEQRELFGQQWLDVQAMFVDDPGGAVHRADTLVMEVMRTRGYPVANFEQRAADLSVHHGVFVQNYRAARDIAERHRRRAATTEELRRAMVYYRDLFEDLLEADGTPTDRQVERTTERDVALPSNGMRADELPRAERPRAVSPPPTLSSDKEAR